MTRRVLQIIGRTAWILPAIIGLGVLSWASFLYPGIKMRSRLWLITAGIYVALAVVVIVAFATAGPSSDPVKAAQGTTEFSAWGGWVVILTWLTGMVVFLILLPRWIKWNPARSNVDSARTLDTATSLPPRNLSDLTDTAALLAPEAPAHQAAERAPNGNGALEHAAVSVNVNAATAEELNNIAGMPAGHGYVIVNERKTHGQFEGLADFLQRVPLDPHVAAKVKDSLTFGQDPTGPSHGRIVDL